MFFLVSVGLIFEFKAVVSLVSGLLPTQLLA